MTRPSGKYAYLNAEPGPKMLLEALKLYGTQELVGKGSSKTILDWADELARELPDAYARWAGTWYEDDSIPWCGLFMAVVAARAGKRPPVKYLSAIQWALFGSAASKAMLGDVLVFNRPGGAHVALYVGEDATAYHCLGGNQSDQVNVTRIAKNRCVAIRRPIYINQPANVRAISLDATGGLSANED